MGFFSSNTPQEEEEEDTRDRRIEGAGNTGNNVPGDEGSLEKGFHDQDVSPPASPSSPPRAFDAALEKRVVRKIDRHLIPLVFILCTSSLLTVLQLLAMSRC